MQYKTVVNNFLQTYYIATIFYMTVYVHHRLPWWISGKEICLPMQGMWVWPLGQEDPLEKEMATHSSIFAWETPWAEQPGVP